MKTFGLFDQGSVKIGSVVVTHCKIKLTLNKQEIPIIFLDR